ncbi:MAG: MgtC/SapB family protein [Deltaproteobacteria bacterium]|nr:MgtC/SapB family protein [Deltaproteobacteria bacterium]
MTSLTAASPFHDVLASVLYRMAFSFICGALVGAEREWKGKAAGLRTNILICLGATLFTIGSELSAVFVGHAPQEASRITAQIVTGVGFLGAGAILHSGQGVVGLTTAATIWLVAAIGVIVGVGFPVVGFLTAGMTVLTLVLLTRIEKRIMGPCDMKTLQVHVGPDRSLELARIEAVLAAAVWSSHSVRVRTVDGGTTFELTYCARHPSHRAVLWELGQVTERRSAPLLRARPESGE